MENWHKIWGYGQLFGYSGFEGPNRYYDDCILMTMAEPLKLRYEFRLHTASIRFPGAKNVVFSAVMSDFIEATIDGKPFALSFADNDTLIGYSPIAPLLEGEIPFAHELYKGVDVEGIDNHFLAHKVTFKDGLYHFVIHHSFAASEGQTGADEHENDDVDESIRFHKSYYSNMPECQKKGYEAMYAKTLAVQKVNVHTAEGKIDALWTTPDRVPHRHMWMWDSIFHGMAMCQYDPKHAEEIVLSMLKSMRKDGFMPHMSNPTDHSDVTQPCILSWGIYEIYSVTKDKEFLKQALPYLKAYLKYDRENRDENHNGLLEWATDPWYDICKCGESGLDNSPRFDFDIKMDCIDFSTYFANDCDYLAKILRILGNEEEAKGYEALYVETKDKINQFLWDEKGGFYCDRLFDGNLTHVLTPISFFPLWAGIPSKEQAEKMVKTLMDEKLMNTPFPFASISQDHPTYSTDMWRGGSWLNLDFFILLGLRRYGYDKLADDIRERILTKLKKWYDKDGTLYEFYDSQDKVAPTQCQRKGDPIDPPDYRIHVHSITDYNWSACFTMLMIQGKDHLS